MTNNFKQANRRYLRVFTPVMLFYVVFCFAGPLLIANNADPSKILLGVFAIITGAPIVVVFWLMGKYLNETDEYTRKVQVDAMLVGGAVTLSTAVIWGFLELFGAIPRLEHLPATMMIGPLFFAAWGITSAFQHIKNR